MVKNKKPGNFGKKRIPKNTHLKSQKNFSFRALIIFVFIFGSIASYSLIRSFADEADSDMSNIVQKPITSVDRSTADLNGDMQVDKLDVAILLANMNSSDIQNDLNGSGKVDMIDLELLLEQYHKNNK